MRDARLFAVSPSYMPQDIGWTAWRRGVAFAAVAGIAVLVVSQSARAEPPGLFSGAYIGLNAGVEWGQSSFSTNPNCPPAIVDAPFCNAAPDPSVVNGEAVAASGSGKLSPSGFTGGVQAGYSWQRGHIVYGAEVDFGALDIDKRATESGLFPFPFLGTEYTLTQKVSADWLATVRGRVGFTMMQHVLLYATGGLAFSDVKVSGSYSDNAIDATFPGGSGYGAKSAIKTGWTAGGGVEWALHGNWLMRAEYLYVDLGSLRVAVPTSNTPGFTQTISVSSDLTAQIGRLGLNYRY